MRVSVEMRSLDEANPERRTLHLEASSYPDAYEAAVGALPDGWELVSVAVKDPG